MSEQLHEQISAFVDGELPEHETQLLLRRLERDRQLQRAYARYVVMGAALRREPIGNRVTSLVERVHAAIAQEQGMSRRGSSRFFIAYRARRWLKPIAGAAVAASVALVAIVGVRQLQSPVEPAAPQVASVAADTTAMGDNSIVIPAGESADSPSYVVPPYVPERRALPAARLTNYVLAHSEYSSVGRRNVLSGVVSEEPATPPATPEESSESASTPVQQP